MGQYISDNIQENEQIKPMNLEERKMWYTKCFLSQSGIDFHICSIPYGTHEDGQKRYIYISCDYGSIFPSFMP